MRFLTGVLTVVLLAVALAVWIMLPWAALLTILILLGVAMLLTRRGRQALQVTRVGVATLPQRLGSSSVILVGIAGVVGVLVALLAMAGGLQATLKASGSNDTAIVLRAGSNNELGSSIDRASTILIAQAPGIAKDAQGHPIASSELVAIVNLPMKSTDTKANVQLRGVGPEAWALYPHIKIIKGRRFTPGLRELVVGKGAAAQFAGLDIGSKVLLGRQPWAVVGEFDAGGAHDSELWGDSETVASAYRRNGFQAVGVRLASPADFGRFKAALLSNPQLKVDVETTRSYYTKQSAGLTKVIRAVGITVAAIMAIGAIFGALNTMYAAVGARAREVATMRAIGFGGLPVVVSVLLETMLLALLGGLLGGAISWLVFNNYTASTRGADFSQVVFQFRVTPVLLIAGLKWALVIGFVGGLFPALRAARVPVTTALREL